MKVHPTTKGHLSPLTRAASKTSSCTKETLFTIDLKEAQENLIGVGAESAKIKPKHVEQYLNFNNLLKIFRQEGLFDLETATLINKGITEERLQNYYDLAFIHVRNSWAPDYLKAPLTELFTKDIEDDKWTICQRAFAYFESKGYLLFDLVKGLNKLIDAKPTDEEWQIYDEIISYYKESDIKTIDKLTEQYADLVTLKPHKEELEIYKYFIDLQKTSKLCLADVTLSFTDFIESDPTKEQLNYLKDLVDYHYKEGLPINEIITRYADLTSASPDNEQWDLFKSTVAEYKNLKRPLEYLIRGFTTITTWIRIQDHNKETSDLLFKLFIEGNKFCELQESPSERFLDCCTGLAYLKAPQALIKNVIEAIEKNHISSVEELEELISETTAHCAFYNLLRTDSDDEKETIQEIIQLATNNDTLPYPLYIEVSQLQADIEELRLNPQAEKAFSETASVIKRAYDIHHGFSSLTFETKRPPSKELSLLGRFGSDIAKSVNYINARDITGYPGRGFVISEIMPEKIFVKSDSLDPYEEYKNAWPWAKEVFDDFSKTKFIFTRGFVAISCTGNEYELKDKENKKTNYSYVVFNDHHHNYGNNVAFLVPTEVLEKKLAETLIPVGHYSGPSTKHKDVNEVGLKPQDLIDAANSISSNVLNVGWGSNIGGGLCNSYPPESEPYHKWERKLKYDTQDSYKHVHKSHLTGTYEEEITKKLEKKLIPLRKAHDSVYALTNRYQNLFDLFRLSLSMWHKGLTLGEEINTFDETINELEELEFAEVEDSYLNVNSLRMLVEAYKWNEARKNGNNNINDFPVLAVVDALDYSSKPDSPVYLDTFDMTLIKKDGEKIQLPLDSSGTGIDETFIWFNQVMPHAKLSTKDLRFYDRRDLNLSREGNQDGI